jgi:hypothetical protein
MEHDADDARRARLFEMIRQQDLSLRALKRLHLRAHGAAQAPAIPSPALLAASLMDQDSASTAPDGS